MRYDYWCDPVAFVALASGLALEVVWPFGFGDSAGVEFELSFSKCCRVGGDRLSW
jgi:hypothetical protein